jgi:hypothetical protein
MKLSPANFGTMKEPCDECAFEGGKEVRKEGRTEGRKEGREEERKGEGQKER